MAVQVSLVVPVFNEAESLPELVDRVEAALAPTGRSFELICCDDGSTDGSDRILADLAATRPWLRPQYLARNYGQSSALQAGFDVAAGDYVVTLDADLQNDPADIPAMLDRLDADPGVDVVAGWRIDRQDALLSRKLPSRMANRLISSTTGVRLHDYGCTLKAFRREIVQRIRLYGELHRFIPSLARDAGARIVEVPVRHHPRTRGVSKYGIDRTLRVLLDLVLVVFFLRYRQRPLHAFGGVGIAVGGTGAAVLLYLAGQKAAGMSIGGRPLLLAGVLLLLAGLQLVVAGLIGELLVRIHHEERGAQFHLRSAPRRGPG